MGLNVGHVVRDFLYLSRTAARKHQQQCEKNDKILLHANPPVFISGVIFSQNDGKIQCYLYISDEIFISKATEG